MKLHAIRDRRPSGSPDKRAGDAWDLYWLLTDLDADGSIRAGLTAASPALRRAVRVGAEKVLVQGAARTRGWLSAGDDQMAQVTAAELRYLGERLVEALM